MYDLFTDADFVSRPSGQARLPGHAMVLAAAGSGKTHRLTSRLIALLALGVPAEEILVSTFTRKAAGEIAQRLLLRLARGAASAEGYDELIQSSAPELSGDDLTRERCAELLVSVARNLHRLQIQTLDAFFYGVARSFGLELGLPSSWSLATEPERRRLQSKAVEEVIRDAGPAALDDLLKCARQGRAERAVHHALLDSAGKLHESFVALDPSVNDPWGFEGGEGAFEPIDDARVEALVRALAEAELPVTKKGEVHKGWTGARAEAVRLLEQRDWTGFVSKGIAKALLEGKDEYSGKPIPAEIRDLHEDLLAAARASLGSAYQRGMEALGRFLPAFDREMSRLAREKGLYRFDDLTHALIRLRLSRASEVFYRLDGPVRHVLLDEFQDTSNAQWAALEPLVRDVFAATSTDRGAVFIVADPKQSIFGWRGGEPRLLDRIAQAYRPTPDTLTKSRRSSSVVLNVVNRAFGEIEHAETLEGVRGAARGWAGAFRKHEPHTDRPGHARLEVGPPEEEETRGRLKPRLLYHAACRVRDLHQAAPHLTIGVLTRKNDSANHLMAYLKSLGVDASEEGGVPIVDSAPVLAVLAALRMTDHPADTVSRYLATMTPVRELLDVEAQAWRDDREMAAVIRRVRGRLLAEGYGPVISEWSRRLAAHVSDRDRRRLRQLGELAFAWDDRGSLRPSEFVSFVESERVEDPASAAVRVMTIHRAKGLEFDAVFLPDLDTLSFVDGSRTPFLPYRDGGTGPVRRIFPRVKSEERLLFPELADAEAQAEEADVRDALSVLYVGLTRARNAVHMFVSPDPDRPSKARTGTRLLRETLAPDQPAVEGAVLFENGDPEWWRHVRGEARTVARRAVVGGSSDLATPLALAPGRRRRLVQRAVPSDLVEAARRPTDALRRALAGEARDRGTVVHRWLEAFEWIEDGTPSDDDLLAVARASAPALTDPGALLERFRLWIQAPAIRGLLSRSDFPKGTEVETELPFIVRDGERIVEGRIDRVARIPDDGGHRVLLVDWKTDELDSDDPATVDEKVDFYRPQLEAYRRALATIESLREEEVEARLAFLSTGATYSISSPS